MEDINKKVSNGLVTTIATNTKATEFENKIPDISNLANKAKYFKTPINSETNIYWKSKSFCYIK